MNLAFCIYKYFPYGGLQRDFARIIKKALEKNHSIDIYTAKWEGKKISNTRLHILSVSGLTNHRRMLNFANTLSKILKTQHYDKVIGFNKIPNLDIYFAGDICLKNKMDPRFRGDNSVILAKARIHIPKQTNHCLSTLKFLYIKLKNKLFFPLLKHLPRYKIYLKLEHAVFNPKSKTKILHLTPQQKKEYSTCYHTQPNRFHLIPAGISVNYLSSAETENIRQSTRQSLKINTEQFILLFIAANFRNKGLDRATKALAALKTTTIKLLIIGSGRQKPYQKLAKKLDVLKQIDFLGTQDDLLPYLLSANLLIHPARVEAAGMVLLEAITTGLPILTTGICGYAFHIQQAQSGMVLPAPFRQKQLNQTLKEIIHSKSRIEKWHRNALSYAKKEDLYGMAEKAVEFIIK